MKKLVVFIIITTGTVLFLYFLGTINQSKVEKSGQVLDKAKYVAGVNQKGISREDYQKNLEATKNFFSRMNQAVSSPSALENDTLDKMIDESLITQYAEEHQLAVSDAEIANRYASVVAGFNRQNKLTDPSDRAFLDKIKEMYGSNKTDYLKLLKTDILKEKVQASVKMPLSDWLKNQRQTAQINKF